MNVSETPSDLRKAVREAIVSSIRQDVERRGARTAGWLAGAGASGVLGALGAMLLLSGHPYGHHPSWHAVAFAATWAGLLVVYLSLIVLRVRTPSLPLDRAAMSAVLGLGVAGVCGALCPEGHFLAWWHDTRLGRSLITGPGLAASALCFGLVTTAVCALSGSLLALRVAQPSPAGAFLPAALLVALLAPGIALQSVDAPAAAPAGWLLGAALGGYGGVLAGSWTGAALARR